MQNSQNKDMKFKPKFFNCYISFPNFREVFDQLRNELLKTYTGNNFGYTDTPYFVIDSYVFIYPRKTFFMVVKLRVDNKKIREQDLIYLKHNEKDKPRLVRKLYDKSEIQDVVEMVSHYSKNFRNIY